MNPTRSMLAIQARPDTKSIRTAELAGNPYTVVPCVALVEGVLWPANAPHPELALAEEFGRFPEGWNGRPVVLNHPTNADGEPISASNPEVVEKALGQIFNTKLEGNKLKTEIWINTKRVEELGGDYKVNADRLIAGKDVVEVSTGLFTMQEVVSGEFNGEPYEAIWRNIVPDHLAVLSEGAIGACSVADGCGAPRANAGTKQFQPVMRGLMLNANACSCGGGGSAPCKCKPTGASAPGTDAPQEEGIFKRLLSTLGGVLGFRGDSKNLSDTDTRFALNEALKAAEDGWFFILAVFQDSETEGKFIYEVGFDGTLFSRDFTIDSATGAVALGSTKQAVRPVTQFVPVVTPTNEPRAQEKRKMDKEQLVRSLIDNAATTFEEADKTWLMALEDTQLQKLVPKVASAPAPTPTPAPAAAPAAAPVEPKTPATTEEYIEGAPAEIREVLNQGLAMQRQRKDTLVKGLMANKRNKFTEEQLRAKGLPELENLSALASDPVDYTAAGGHFAAASGDDGDEGYTPAPLILSALNQKPASGAAQ